ncbi:glycoside hydrolase family 2 [Paenibacillus pabuli]|uniref:glycoside hydrolase family 2 n=1 Tax=Paenibacillus pabuli TaxID=1472 RepID=UPI0007836E15|nr:glycoside hydrolase family 2 [Paenibacillus pabuli]MEC0125883.1 glycoside hydrolase family 2 [Paenibacillus pabuli]
MNISNKYALRHTFNLNGTWQFCLDSKALESSYEQYLPPIQSDDQTIWEEIQIPGSWEEQGYGDEPEYQRMDTWTKVREYEGAAWYAKDVHIPVGDPGCRYVFRLKGVRWTTNVWINGCYAGQQDSLLTHQEWDITSFMKEGGMNRIDLRVDNTMKYPLAGSHIHSLHTATTWGGITGGAFLDRLPPHRIQQFRLQPERIKGTLSVHCFVSAPVKRSGKRLQLHMDIQHPTGRWLPRCSCDVEMDHPNVPASVDATGNMSEVIREVQDWQLELGEGEDIALWSDESPALYRAVICLHDGEQELDRMEEIFGVRSFAVKGQQLELNDTPVFLRGYVDCCIFPLTGYPVWDKEHYNQQFRIAKSYGFNHVRLHGWSAPEPFWEAADEEGMLVQAELPHWSRLFEQRGQSAPAEVLSYLTNELEGLLQVLHKHPSFVMFSMGNELIGPNGHPELNELVQRARHLDPTRLYTDNTGFGQLPAQGREADYYIQSLNWHPPLESELSAIPDTTLDYHAVTRLADRPVVGHEHAQFTMYVRPQERQKYTGVLRPSWLQPIEESLSRKGLTADLENFQQASGIHLVRSLKEAMERIRRTEGAAGVQLLDIRDFPGQGHATTGILDVFWESKGIIEPAVFRQFNANVVLLLSCSERTFYAGEAICIEARISHYGQTVIRDASIHWRLVSEDVILDEGILHCGKLSCGEIHDAGRLKTHAPLAGASSFYIEAELRAGDSESIATNVWHGWSFPLYQTNSTSNRIWSSVDELQPYLLGAHHDQVDHLDGSAILKNREQELVIIHSLTPNALDYLINGGSVWLHTHSHDLYDRVETKYLPVFWNYLMFATQPGATMGMHLQDSVPLLGSFPYDRASDWHWYHLVNGAPAICLDTLEGVQPLIEVIDHFHRGKRLAYVFEAKVGKGKLLVSSLPFTDTSLMKRPEAAYLFQEMVSYLLGEEFHPESSISVGELLGTVKLNTIRFAL